MPIKIFWNYASNCLINQHGDINHTHEILQDDKKCEMIVASTAFMTSSAKYADILLPDLMPAEQDGLISHASCREYVYVIFNDQVIKPRFECKPSMILTSELANVLALINSLLKAVPRMNGCKYLHAQNEGKRFLNCQRLKMKTSAGIFKKTHKGITSLIRAFREDPQANPLTTPSGKIEIYSQALATLPLPGNCQKVM